MSRRLPAVKGEDVVAVLQEFGFVVRRTTGSYVILGKEGQRFNISVPCYGSFPLKRGTLRQIIKDSGLSVEQFRNALR